MIEAITRPAPAQARYFPVDLPFLIQVSRPGLWTTTALFYLMPLGSQIHWRSPIFWVGLLYVLLPLGLLLYGANDIVDAQTDSLNPRKGTFLFGSRGGPEQLAALRWQIGIAQIPFLILFFLFVGPRILWWVGLLLLAVGVYNAPRFGWKGRPPVRRTYSSKLFVNFCFKQLAESQFAASVANIPLWSALCNALPYFWRSDGH